MARVGQYHHQPSNITIFIYSKLEVESRENFNSNKDGDTNSSDFNAPVEIRKHPKKKNQKRPVPDISIFAGACDCTVISN